MSDLYKIEGQKLKISLHPGQSRAWQSERRFVGVIAGTQSGKTSFLPLWLYREIQRKGPGDYAIVCPTFSLLELKALTEFRRLFEQTLTLGRYTSSPVRKFVFSADAEMRMFGKRSENPTQVFFGYAENPDSLESATYKAVACDEAGQKAFKRDSWEALLRRLSIHQGRALITTTPYNSHGWLRTEIFDKYKSGDKNVDLIQFSSIQNPSFPKEEFERAQRDLPGWKFELFYKGQLARPPGLIYDSFLDSHKVPRFAIPDSWERYMGIDFGGVNTAAVFLAKEPNTTRYFMYREYKAGGRSAAEHCYHLLQGEARIPYAVGGSKSEGQWRTEFRSGGVVNGQQVPGIPIMSPTFSDVEVGIDRVYGAHKRNEILVFDDLHGYLEQKQTYARELDKNGEPTEKIEDKETFHYLDAERYIGGYLFQQATTMQTKWRR